MRNFSDSRLPAYLRLRDRLTAKIVGGEWQANQLLPSDNELARETGLSVGTVRKAMSQLVQEGLLEHRQGFGTFLHQSAFRPSLFRFFSLYPTTDAQDTIPKSLLIVRARNIAPPDIADILQTQNAIHIQRLRYNASQVFLTEDIWLPLPLFAGFETLTEREIGTLLYPLYLEKFKILVTHAIADISFSKADTITAQHLAIAEGDSVAVIERTAYSDAEQPVEWRIARGPANHFRYRSHITPHHDYTI